jgi:hypothetical protein
MHAPKIETPTADADLNVHIYVRAHKHILSKKAFVYSKRIHASIWMLLHCLTRKFVACILPGFQFGGWRRWLWEARSPLGRNWSQEEVWK